MIGFTPAEVDQMSLWEFQACCEGWRRAHSSGEDEMPAPPSNEKFEEMLERHARIYH